MLRVRRPKTKVDIELPLLPAVARALTAYLRWERPPAKGMARVFLRRRMPYAPITSGAIRHRLRLYAKRAGVSRRWELTFFVIVTRADRLMPAQI